MVKLDIKKRLLIVGVLFLLSFIPAVINSYHKTVGNKISIDTVLTTQVFNQIIPPGNFYSNPYYDSIGSWNFTKSGSIWWLDSITRTWHQFSGGSGGSQDLNSVLTVGNSSTIGATFGNLTVNGSDRNRYIDFVSNSSFPNIPQSGKFRFCGSNLGNPTFIFSDGTKLLLGKDSLVPGTTNKYQAAKGGGDMQVIQDSIGGTGQFPIFVTKSYIAGYQPSLSYTPENIANKVTSFSSPNNTSYPTTLSVINLLNTSYIYSNGFGLNLSSNIFSVDTTKIILFTDTGFKIPTYSYLISNYYTKSQSDSRFAPISINGTVTNISSGAGLTGTVTTSGTISQNFSFSGTYSVLQNYTSGIHIQSVTSTPSSPITGFVLYADGTNAFSWIGSNGFVRTFDGTGNTANRVYGLCDHNAIIDNLTTSTTSVVGYLKGVGSNLTFNSTIPFSDITGTLGASQGGTGSNSLTSHNILIGNGTGSLNFLSPSTTGKIVQSNGTDFVMTSWTFSSPSTLGNILVSDGTNWTSSSTAVSYNISSNSGRTSYTSTVTGFSSTTSTLILYDTVGNKCFLTFSITGASNSAAFTGTIPFAAAVSGGNTLPLLSSSSLINGQISITSGSNIATFGGTTGTANFGASGTKGALNVNFEYYFR